MLDGRLVVTMTGRFTRDGPARYTLLEARGGLMGSVFSLVSIKWAMDQGLSARITYDRNHVYLEIAFEPGGFPPPLDTQRPHEITPAPASVSEAGRADKPSSSAEIVFRPTVAGLTFEERVAYQYAIEEVYWRHRIWPKENPRTKPPLDAVISREQIEKKVTDYLRKSQLVTDQRCSPISASELQAEMDRMASHTKRPDRLRELFEALGNDPYVIAECLVRPILAERLLREFTNGRDGPLGRPLWPALDLAQSAVAPYQTDIAVVATSDNGDYKLPEISTNCTDDTWTATTTVNAPDARDHHTTVWTGSEMIIWGGFINSTPYFLDTGGRYNPATDSWIATNTGTAPIGRDFHTAVWTGTEMVVWGGYNDGNDLNSGGRYDPATDSWIATSTINAPEARWAHTVEWTGTEMIVWGGTNDTILLNTGGRYNPDSDSWTATGLPNDVLGRAAHTAIWTGDEMIVWGGGDSTFHDCNTGGRYNPIACQPRNLMPASSRALGCEQCIVTRK